MKHEIPETLESPKMVLDSKIGLLRIEGKSYAENVNDSFKELFVLLEQYALNPQQITTIEFKWLYYNTATSRMIITILNRLKEFSHIKVKWFCKKEAFMMIRKGTELSEILDMDVEIIFYD